MDKYVETNLLIAAFVGALLISYGHSPLYGLFGSFAPGEIGSLLTDTALIYGAYWGSRQFLEKK